jgi:glycosylphosphatidylinositol transamidase (GPIT) subunit GPI8
MYINLVEIFGLWFVLFNFIHASQPTHTNNWAVIGIQVNYFKKIN